VTDRLTHCGRLVITVNVESRFTAASFDRYQSAGAEKSSASTRAATGKALRDCASIDLSDRHCAAPVT